MEFSFNNTEIAFRAKSDAELKNSNLLFTAIGYNWLVKAGPALVNMAFALHLPVKGIIKKTVFKQFCGGESIEDCSKTIDLLHSYKIGTILDYSVEGKEADEDFEFTTQQTIRTIRMAHNNEKIPFSVFKVSGLARLDLLTKVSEGKSLTPAEQTEFEKVRERIGRICKEAYIQHVRLFIDAEESWFQLAIDQIVEEMMELYNKEEVIIYNTVQMYRHDRLQYIADAYARAEQKGYHMGLKIVRGAYMEKERERAAQMGYTDPIQPDKAATDRDYNKALEFCITHIHRMAVCVGTHNEDSSAHMASLMQKHTIAKNDKRIYFSQLFGMSDHISYNLSHAGYFVSKYLPYGPVQSVLPYLFRRAQENTSVQGQAGRELSLVQQELKRRKLH